MIYIKNVTNLTNRYMDFILDLDEEFYFQRPVCVEFLHQDLWPFKSEIFHFFGHKRDTGMGMFDPTFNLVTRVLDYHHFWNNER